MSIPKLTNAQRQAIIEQRKAGVTIAELAAEFNVSWRTVFRVLRRQA